MRRYLALLPVLLVLTASLLSFGTSAQAKTVHPAALSGLAFQDWNGNVYGGFTSTNVVDHNSTAMSGGGWDYYISLLNSTWTVNVGMEYMGASQGGVCGTGTGLQFFYEIVKSSVVQTSHCYTPTQKQIGRFVQFGVSYFVTNGPGIYVWINNTGDSANDFCNPCSFVPSPASHPTYTNEDLDINASNVTFNTGGGSAFNSPILFVGNEYDSTSGVISFQGAAGTQTSPNPPSLFQQISPASEDGGGLILGCITDTTVNHC